NFVPRAFDGRLDGRALAFTLGLSLLTGIVFGLAPALVASKPDFVAALKGDTPGRGGRARGLGLRDLVVVMQVALLLVVVVGSGWGFCRGGGCRAVVWEGGVGVLCKGLIRAWSRPGC